MNTVLITGASSGIGKATVEYFAKRNWQVIATVRDPKKAPPFQGNVTMVTLDVKSTKSVLALQKFVMKKFNHIDVLVNNAGYGLFGAIETCDENEIEDQFNTNVYGPLRLIKAFLPSLRERNSGTIINVSSIVGKMTVPTMGYYCASKHALTSLSEALWFDLQKTNVRVKVIEPGMIETRFPTQKTVGSLKIQFYERVMRDVTQRGDWKGSSPMVIAKLIYHAANDHSRKLRYHGGKFSTLSLLARKLLPDCIFYRGLKMYYQ